MTLDQVLARLLDVAPALTAVIAFLVSLGTAASARRLSKDLSEQRRRSEERINFEAALRGRLVRVTSPHPASIASTRDSANSTFGSPDGGPAEDISPDLRSWMAQRGEAIEAGLHTVALSPDDRK